MKLEALHENAGKAEQLLKALANRQRLMVLCELHAGERSVSALNARLELSQSALSQHLSVLRSEGIVATRRESQTIYYRLASPEASRVVALLAEIFCGPDVDDPEATMQSATKLADKGDVICRLSES